MSTEPNTSVHWNGNEYTGYANEGARYGEATGDSPEGARTAAVKALGKSPERQAPVAGAGGTAPEEKAPKA